ncbi:MULTISPECIES: hypothetical protein [unclassified Sphingomonas]|uniref:hypothetical protein n=1 Tax=unclassified Sphingomonas TaxID=196159 RepID=UPI0006F32CA1|nr:MULTISPECIES: hypothetical protein [unclassified Sphingomonas]KQY69383.1 hypothetical protein ASD39_03595 [Sphingomonas sp. Root50]KRB89641.1 hypothetical protein ASE22_18505 [Sphingomonas sp. Root720]
MDAIGNRFALAPLPGRRPPPDPPAPPAPPPSCQRRLASQERRAPLFSRDPSLRWGDATDAIGNRFALGTPFQAAGGRQITPLRPRAIRIGLDKSF